MSGTVVSGVVDLILGGGSLGIFFVIGGASGAGIAAFGGVDSLAKSKKLGKYFAVHENNDSRREFARKKLMEMLRQKLLDISQAENIFLV